MTILMRGEEIAVRIRIANTQSRNPLQSEERVDCCQVYA